jgi:hypothetical protein
MPLWCNGTRHLVASARRQRRALDLDGSPAMRRFRREHPVLSVGLDGEPLDLGEQRDRTAHAAVVGGGEVVVSEHDAARPEHGPGQVDVGPRGVEVVPRVHLDEVGSHAPLAQRAQRGRRGEGQRQHPVPRVLAGRHHVGHELCQQQRVAVPLWGDVAPEPGAEARPPAEVVDAEDGRGQRQVPRRGGHVQRRRAQERAQLHDRVRAYGLDQLREHGARRAPPARARRRRVQQRRDVRRGEARVRALPVEELLEERREHGVAGDRLPALLLESEQVVRRRPRVARRHSRSSGAVRRLRDDGGDVLGARPYDGRRVRRLPGRWDGRRQESEGVADGKDDEE